MPPHAVSSLARFEFSSSHLPTLLFSLKIKASLADGPISSRHKLVVTLYVNTETMFLKISDIINMNIYRS